MNFFNIDDLVESARKSTNVFFIAVATTYSDGGIPGRIVRIHDPKFFQTSFGSVHEMYCNSPCAINPS